MNKKTLHRANILQKEIENLEKFYNASIHNEVTQVNIYYPGSTHVLHKSYSIFPNLSEEAIEEINDLIKDFNIRYGDILNTDLQNKIKEFNKL